MKLSNFKIKTKLIVGFAAPLALLIAVATVSLSITSSLQDANKWVDHTHNVIREGNAVLGSAVDMETGMRGYLLAGQEQFLEPYNGGGKAFDELVAELQKTVSDNPAQVQLLDEIHANITAWKADVVEPTITLRREIGDAETMDDMADLVGEARGKAYFDKFREQIATFIEREQKLMDQRSKLIDDILKSKDATRFDDLTDGYKWVEHTHTVIATANDILASAVDMETGMRGYLLAGQEQFLEPYNGGGAKFTELLTGLKQTVSDNPEQVTLLSEIETTISGWKTDVVEPTLQLRRKIGDAATMNDMADLVAEARGKVYFDKFREQIATFNDREASLLGARKTEAANAAATARITVLGASGAALVIAGLIVLLLVRAIVKPVKNLVDAIGYIGSSLDLTRRIDAQGKDELAQLGNSFNGLMGKVNDTLSEVSNASSDVAAASTEIAASAEHIAAGAGEQSQQITQVSSAVEEMSASVVEVARKSADAANSANESGRLATEGGDVVEQTITGMASINEAVSSSATSVQELGKRGEQIGEVITVINDIADQTNLLALNAAIEAARAGEHGRGFAVVADEVRKLADRTTKATDEIAGSIQAIQTETTTAVQKMNAGTEEVTTGVEKAEQAGDSLKQIVASAQDVSAMVQSIAAAAEEQSAASEQVSRNIEQIASVTRQTSEGTNQAAAAATQLSQRAETLQQLVGQFKTDRG